LFDPADPFAEFYLHEAQAAAKAVGVRFITAACTAPGDIGSGIQALKAKGAGGIVQIPSVMIGGGFAAVVKASRQAGLPLIATSTSYQGAPLALGLSFFQNGYDMGLLMMRILRGEDPAKIPFQRASRRMMVVNLAAAKDYGVTIPLAIVNRADSVTGGTALIASAATQTVDAAKPLQRKRNNPFEFWLVAITQGLAYAALAWGVYLASRVLRFADITPDGSFPLGAAVSASLIVSGMDPLLATFIAILAGMASGYVTALLEFS
jgi:putative ABC transport system permease protein